VAQDHNDIYTIVERLRILEEGLDKNQRSVNQLGPTFKPKTVAVLTAKKDPKNPMAGKLVGGDESVEHEAAVLEADMAEDVLAKVAKIIQRFYQTSRRTNQRQRHQRKETRRHRSQKPRQEGSGSKSQGPTSHYRP
jgi:hypothetical protein